MTPGVHWTHDPRYKHLRHPPAWYQRQDLPIYTPKPSARMEKQSAEDNRRQWQWQASDGVRSAFDHEIAEASCWPCGVYSRTSYRMRAALGGHDADHIPEQGCFTYDCLNYALCFPFYGCLLAKLQNTVRAFYDIDGSDGSDLCDGCCCPCLTLVRNENEIIFRERQHRRIKHCHGGTSSVTEPYHSESPMRSSTSSRCKPCGGRSKAPSPEYTETEPEHDCDGDVLPTIPELSREASTAGPTSRHTSCSTVTAPKPQIHRLSADPTIQTDAGTARVHYLDQDWYLVPVEKKENRRHSLAEDIFVNTNTPKADALHGPHRDPMMFPHENEKPSPHHLHEDQTTAAPRPTATKGHTLHDDELAPHQTVPTIVSHHLEDDATVATPPPTVSRHDIHQDQMAPYHKPAASRPHGIHQDFVIATGSRNQALGHGLESDAATPVKQPESEPHELRNDGGE